MGKYEKLISEILKLNKNLRFDELSKLLENIGYKPKSPKGGSSHVTFRKTDKLSITIPQGNPVNKAYIKLVHDALVEYESEESEDDE